MSDFLKVMSRKVIDTARGAVSRIRSNRRFSDGEIIDRLDRIDANIDDVRFGELRSRLVHIELKINQYGDQNLPFVPGVRSDIGFDGHADQAFGHLTYAQFGEDLIVAGLFSRLGIERPSYLDIGAHHPLNCSNTALLYKRGSRGVNVEANPTLIAAFQQLRPEDTTINVGVGPAAGQMTFYRIDDFSGRNTFSREVAEAFVRQNPTFTITDTIQVQIRTIDEIVASEFGGRWPDLLTLDAEGLDFAILNSANFGESGPCVIIVEAISGDNADASIALNELLLERGYKVLFQTPGNLIAVRGDAAGKLDYSGREIGRRPRRPSVCNEGV